MNTNGLARQYDKLTPWERVPLILTAHRRGDEAEGERLARAAPLHSFRVPDYYGLSEGLRMLAVAWRLEQLDLAAFFWRLETFVADWSAGPSDRETEGRIERLENIQKMLAYRFLVRCEAWKLLCAGLHLSSDALDRYLPGNDHMAHLEEEARMIAFTRDEALDYLSRQYEAAETAAGKARTVRREYRMETAADIAQALREYLDDHLKSWA